MTADTDTKRRGRVVYLSHGGGPLPILGDEGHRAMADFMNRFPGLIDEPEAVLVISAHWEESVPTLISHPRPELLFDYFGFPSEAYQLTYAAPPATDLTRRIRDLLESQGLSPQSDPNRGWDHGVFIPMKMMYPQAHIPVAQISLLTSLDADDHLALGRALSPLLDQNILVIGSGFSFHNMQAFFGAQDGEDTRNDAFQDWLKDSCCGAWSQEEREERLSQWKAAPQASYCHPRQEHLLPLHVCAALASGPAKAVFDDRVFGKRALAFLW